jgi:putative flippase GtrA
MFKLVKYVWDNRIRLLKYLLVGGSDFVLHTFILWLFLRKIFMQEQVGITVAYIISIAYHFLFNNFFTFGDSKSSYKRRITGYLIMVGINYVINMSVNSVMLKLVNNVLFANFAAVACTTLFGFLVLNRLVFKSDNIKQSDI